MKLYWVGALFIVSIGCPIHTPVHKPMYGLPISQSDQRILSLFQSVYNKKSHSLGLIYDQLVHTECREIWLFTSQSVNHIQPRKSHRRHGLSRWYICWRCLPRKHYQLVEITWLLEGAAILVRVCGVSSMKKQMMMLMKNYDNWNDRTRVSSPTKNPS